MGKISFIFKTAILGPENCGKKKFLKLCPYFHEFGFKTAPSIGVDFGMFNFHHQGNKYIIQGWNLNDNTRFRNFYTSYLRGTKGALVFFNLNDRQTFEELNIWISLIRYTNTYIPIILVGVDDIEERKIDVNKNDESPYEVNESEIKSLCDYYLIEGYFTFKIDFKIETGAYTQNKDYIGDKTNKDNLFNNLKFEVFPTDFYEIESKSISNDNQNEELLNCNSVTNEILETLLERILYYKNHPYPEIDFNCMISTEQLAQFLHPINAPIDHQNQPELLKYFYKFISRFNKCPICKRENHPSYMQSFFFSKDVCNVNIRDNILFLLDRLENRTDKDEIAYVNVGIPCCSCYEKIFHEKPHL